MRYRFKVGDLVTVVGLDNMFGFEYMQNGTVGVVTELLYGCLDDDKDDYYFDYRVSINGAEYSMFEEELESFYKPCSSCECDPCDCGWGHDEDS